MQKNVKLLHCVNVKKQLSNFRVISVRITCFVSAKTNLNVFYSYINKINFRHEDGSAKDWHM